MSKALFIWVDILSVVPGNPVSSRGCNSFSLFGGRRKGGCGEEPGTRSCRATAPLGPGMNLQCREGGREEEKTHTLRMIYVCLKQGSFELQRLCVTSRFLLLL